MSDAAAFLARLIEALDRAGVPHMLAGSFASSLHGTPRATQDVDLVIDPTFQSLDPLLAALGGEGGRVEQMTIAPYGAHGRYKRP